MATASHPRPWTSGNRRDAARDLRAPGEQLRRHPARTPPINLRPVEALPGSNGRAAMIGRAASPRLVPMRGPAEVTLVEHLGSENHLHLNMNGHRLVTLAAPEQQWRPGARAHVALNRPLYFDAGGRSLAAR